MSKQNNQKKSPPSPITAQQYDTVMSEYIKEHAAWIEREGTTFESRFVEALRGSCLGSQFAVHDKSFLHGLEIGFRLGQQKQS
jgi:hypothetical protein